MEPLNRSERNEKYSLMRNDSLSAAFHFDSGTWYDLNVVNFVEAAVNLREKGRDYEEKILLTIGSIIVILFAAGAGYVWWMYHSVASTAGDMYETSAGKGNHKAVTNKKPISLLLLGVDERQGDHGRSDTMIATTLNPKTKTMQMISIPRDTRTEIVGRRDK
ncbi:cell envelope-associated transcriptional attenuator LytR-CpsA-Psr [Sporolactobacillus inulinus]|uniref:Cell envelope-associated transcriptional attenuator LytR-CpsA-Psr n=1 Tax=Sporolactobacillus inulinus TaxID=2078 RepID=A0A4Y1ZHD4_9BACL|nr:cell envelope-associated transcriptional attenuator LytR-CpsA-Psr [Sporolactobacillus inulinus]